MDSHEVDEQEFQFCMRQLTYDVDVWRVHNHTCSDYIAAVSKHNHTWNLKRHEQRRNDSNKKLRLCSKSKT